MYRAVRRLLRGYAAALTGRGPAGRARLLAQVSGVVAAALAVLAVLALTQEQWLLAVVLLETALLALGLGLVGFLLGGRRPAKAPRAPKRTGATISKETQLAELAPTLDAFRSLAAAGDLARPALPLALAPLTANPLVSVIVPAHNEAKHLDVAVTSVLEQSWTNLEVIVVDDGSTDGTPNIIMRLLARDPRVRHVRHLTAQGLSAARNAGVARARGELVVFLDGDDALHARAISQRMKALHASDLRVTVGSAGRVLQVPSYWKPTGHPRHRGDLSNTSIWSVGVRSPFAVHQVMLRRDVLDIVGGFDEALRHGAEDLDLWLRLLRRGYVFAQAPSVDAFYRQRAGSMIEDKRAQHLDAAVQLLRGEPAGSGADLLDPGTTAVAYVVAERAAGWCAAALISGKPNEAWAALQVLNPDELLALRSGVDLNRVTTNAVRRAELRVRKKRSPIQRPSRAVVSTVSAAIHEVVAGDDVQSLVDAPTHDSNAAVPA